MIRKAIIEDMDEIMEIVKETIIEMNSYNNNQWNENYPQKQDFINDIEKGDLFVMEKDNKIAGFTCINKIEPIEYNDLNWLSNKEAFIIHRMAVASDYRREGIGVKLMKFEEELAAKKNVKYFKIDTYSLNKKAQRLFEKFGYKFVGEVNFSGREKSFYCYEKLLK